MTELNLDYLGKHKKFRIDRKKFGLSFILVALLVAIIIFWCLKLVGITITGEAFCGMSEHVHDKSCYSSELICGYKDKDANGNPHSHTDKCYKLICTKQEHIHTVECYPDENADLENAVDWLKTFDDVEFTDNAEYNILEVAKTQVGYTESRRNFQYKDGEKKGYTRYGDWYNTPYEDWNTIFVSFCINYGKVENSNQLISAGAESMRRLWNEKGFYADAKNVTPERGWIVFFDDNSDGAADRVGILNYYGRTVIIVTEGDRDNSVAVVPYKSGSAIMGYGMTNKLTVEKAIVKSNKKAVYSTRGQNSTQQTAQTYAQSSANITYISHLEDEVVAVVFKELTGQEITNGSTVYIGETYMVSLEFSEINTGSNWIQFRHNEEGYLTYQVPDNIHCEPFDDWHKISAKTENGTIADVGEYYMDETGLLKVKFYKDANGVNFVDKYSNVDFSIDFNATVAAAQAGSSSEIKFNDKININLNVDGNASMKVVKTHGEYDPNDHTMSYTIRVEATHGVVKDLVLDDQIWENHHTLKDTVVVTDLQGNVLDPQPTISANPGAGIEAGSIMSGFPDFAAGQGFIIKYKTQINDDMLTNETVSLWNGVYSYGKNSVGGTVDHWTDDWINVELEKMTKEGKQSVITDDNGNAVPVIEWEVEIRKDNHDLQGTVIIDTLGDGLQYYTGKDIRVVHYDQYGNKLPDTYISWNNVTVNGNSMSFALPDGYAFKLVYYTTYEEPDGDETKNYSNRIKATINGREESASGTANVVGFVPYVKKTASGTDGDYVYFTIEADVPGVIKDWGTFYLTDLAAFWGYNNDVGHLYVQNVPQDLIVTATTESGQTIEFTPYVNGGPTENTYILVAPALGDQEHSFNIFFNTSTTDKVSSKWILGEDSTLKITYKIPFDAKTGTEWTGGLTGNLTLEDVLLEGNKLANEAYLTYTNIITGTGSTNYEYSPQVTKKSLVHEHGTIDYTVSFNNTVPGSGGNKGYINSSVNEFWFNDTFDERLEYVPGSLVVTTYSPWNKNLWITKYQYTGEVTGNTIRVDAGDFVLIDYNEEASASGWDWISTAPIFRNYYQWVSSGGKYEFTYQLKVKDEYIYTTDYAKFELDNTVELTWGNDNTSGPVTETSVFYTGLLHKHVVQDDSRLDFEVHINRESLDILVGSDTLTVQDTMTPNLSVYWDTIRLTYENENGEMIDFNSPESKHTYIVTYDSITNSLMFIVPDSLHVIIEYTTLITESGLVSVENSVLVDGKAEVADVISAFFRVQEHSGDASGSNHKITLLKQDGLTYFPLPGAVFLLYGPMGDPEAVLPEGAAQYVIADDGTVLRYIGSYTTGEDGTVPVETQYLTFGGPYAFVEMVAPEGYDMLQTPTYFYFYEQDPNGMIQTVTTIIAIENYKGYFIFPETGGIGTLPLAIVGVALMVSPVLYSIIRRKRGRRRNLQTP